MNCPATTQQSLSKNKLDWLNTSISGSLTNKRSHMQRDAPSITQTLAHKYNAHHTHKHDQFTHQALYWSGYLLLESPAMAFQLSRERDKEKGRVKYRLANKYNHQCFFSLHLFFMLMLVWCRYGMYVILNWIQSLVFIYWALFANDLKCARANALMHIWSDLKSGPTTRRRTEMKNAAKLFDGHTCHSQKLQFSISSQLFQR